MARYKVGAVASAALAICLAVGAASPALAADAAGPAASDEGNAALIEAEPAAAPDAGQANSAARDRASIFGEAAFDLLGYESSLYTGKWFMPGKEDIRRCIINRESNANYRATNGTYHGAYQMSAALAVGATWMMQREVRKEMGDEGVRIVQELREQTPNKWNRYWQDRAFWTIWRNGEGSRHWNGGC